MYIRDFPFWMRLLLILGLLMFGLNGILLSARAVAFLGSLKVYDWQTLIAGVLALFGAAFAFWGIQRQIAQIDRMEKERLTRSETAARAVLPLALSELCDYAHECIDLLDPLTEPPPNPVPRDATPPPLDQNVIIVLREAVLYAEPSVVKKIAGLLGKVQVQRARLASLLDREKGNELAQHDGVNAMLDAAEVYARASELFDYARDIAEVRNRPDRGALRNALWNCGIWNDDHPALAELAEVVAHEDASA